MPLQILIAMQLGQGNKPAIKQNYHFLITGTAANIKILSFLTLQLLDQD